ncbi:hypothetical protein LR48_Vigan07g187900 [Vigna angularis]|uniref:Uncharacterized protein n=1 Tax=Phaseolus angularis TaxID=3914 RepID=A0A0L9UZ86_PHAAN|nr:hypothetical protein LR48_Vigan07g187900 [Vigna angularis]
MVDHPRSSGDEALSSRPIRGATRLKQLMVRRNNGERTPVDVNVITCVASGPNRDAFRSYLGVLARDRINILTPSFEHVSETHGQEKIRLSEDNPVSALHQLCDIIRDEPMKVEYDANVFGRGSKVPIYLHSQDVRELASGREEYMFGVSNNMGYNDVYGFIDPQVIHEANDFDDITTYLTNRFGSGKEIYFVPYISGSIAARMMLVGRSTANGRKLAWVALKRFKTLSPLLEKSLTFLRKAFTKHLVRLYNSS